MEFSFCPARIKVVDVSKVWGNNSFGSLRTRSGGFKCCTEHFLTLYDSCTF